MSGLADLDDRALLLEYQQSVKRLEGLDPALPKPMHDIRAKYRDYIGQELAARGLLASSAKPQPVANCEDVRGA